MKIKFILKFISIIILACISCLFVLMFYFSKTTQTPFVETTNKKWSHRGYSQNCAENSILSVEKANSNNYQGVEIDVWFYNGNLIVSHDKPSTDSIIELGTFLIKFPSTKFWLDFKNLTANNSEAVAKKLSTLELNKKRIIIESKNATALNSLSKKGFITCLWINPVDKPIFYGALSKQGLIELLNIFSLTRYNFNAISMPMKLYEHELIQQRYNHLNIHVWSDKSSQDRAYLDIYNKQEVQIILDDDELHNLTSTSTQTYN